MNFRTVIDPPRNPGYLDHRQHLLLLGSCFVENVGAWLQQRKFDVDINPFGTLYNPESIARNWERIVSGSPFTADNLFQANGLWHSYDHHSRFSSPDRECALGHINRRLARAHDRLPETDRIVVTWGSAYAYRLHATGEVVANCHKQPAALFSRELLPVEAIGARWLPLVRHIETTLPRCRVLFTVSPIRHLSDGAHGNQLSKATLLLAIDRLQRESRICDYFPSYEIVMDDLRDYRFYDTDMTHRAGRARATEEDQIARLQVGNTLDRRAFLILAAGTAGNIQIILTIDVTGKTGTIEILGTGSSGTITNAQILHGFLHQGIALYLDMRSIRRLTAGCHTSGCGKQADKTGQKHERGPFQ